MGNVRIKLNDAGVEEIEDSFSSVVLGMATTIQHAANAMKNAQTRGAADYNVGLRPGRKGGRHYAVVSADAPSTRRDNAKNNTLAKAGW